LHLDLRGGLLHVTPPARNAAGDSDWLLLVQPVGGASA
jgi:hypothetical protein